MSKDQKTKKKSQKTYHLAEKVTTPSLDLYQKYKEDKTIKLTSLFVRTYASTEEVERLIEVLNPDEYAYILHDKDKTPEGQPKEPHIHLLMYKKASRIRLTKVLTFTEQATRVEIPRSNKYAYEYLTHKNDPDKASYPKEAIHEYHKDVNTFEVTQQEARHNRNMELLDDINNLTRRQMAEKYGSDYIKNYQRYEAFMQHVRDDEMEAECEQLASVASPEEEVYYMSDMSGDELRLSLADYVCVQLRNSMEGERMPTPKDIVTMYYKALQVMRDRRQQVARALHISVADVEAYEV